ncbi:hypothetical protein ATJ93_0815 [Halopiger aswanensis]|uniref:Uncharacterized protein n=2 Tax=Halopiger aswanensis TaxID=148449 RepID=A0A3R7FXZ9_9EURY|nr:hypothetical protein ATJ93_0815 [Halopiger aswanensis]
MESAVDYEITVAALIATALLISPGVSQVLTIPTIGAALLLLLLTLLRRMALINPHSRQDWIMSRSTPLLVVTTTYSFLYLSLVVGSYLTPIVPATPLSIAMTLCVVAALLSVVLYEILYRDFFLLMSLHVWNVHLNSRGTPFGNEVLAMSKTLLERSVLPEDEYPPQARRIQETGLADTEEQSLGERIGSRLGVALGAAAFTGVFLLPMAAATFVFPTSSVVQTTKITVLSLLFALATNYSIVSTRFLYGRYGRDDFGELSSNKWRYVQYSLVVYVLFGLHFAYERGLVTNLV